MAVLVSLSRPFHDLQFDLEVSLVIASDGHWCSGHFPVSLTIFQFLASSARQWRRNFNFPLIFFFKVIFLTLNIPVPFFFIVGGSRLLEKNTEAVSMPIATIRSSVSFLATFLNRLSD